MSQYETLLIDRVSPHVLKMTFNRPDAMNAMNTQMGLDMREFFHTFDHFQEPDVRCLVVTGAGEKAFSAGGDLKQRLGMTDVAWRQQHVVFEEAVEALWRFPMPVIAAVNGLALGGGCEMALACDFIVAAERAKFGQPEVKLGIMPGAGGTQRLPRRIGIGRGKELLFTGRFIDAQEAYAWGLANHVVPADQLMDKALELASMIADNGPVAVRQAKKSVDRGIELPMAEALDFEIQAYNLCVPTEDRREGVLAFNEKRKPDFRNR